MFPTVRFLDKETGFDTSDMRRLLPVFSYIAEQTGKSWKKTKQLDCFRIKGAESYQLISQFERCP